MSNILYLEREDAEGVYVEEVPLRTKREVCWRCHGNGTHTNPSIDGNGISGAEWAEWDDDDREAYLTGAYDVVCQECNGRNVIDIVDLDALTDDQRVAWEAQIEDERSYRAMVASEQRMGA